MNIKEEWCYREAKFIIDPGASNPAGLIHALDEMLETLREVAQEEQYPSDWVINHPTLFLAANQLAQIMHVNNNEKFIEAYDKLKEVMSDINREKI
jgi:hypothetical protein